MFKTLAQVSQNELGYPEVKESKLVHFISVIGGVKQLDPPEFSDRIVCPICSSKEAWFLGVKSDGTDNRLHRVCGNLKCATNDLNNQSKNVNYLQKPQRAVDWKHFCERNHLGDINHDITFESIKQSDGKIQYMRKFCNTPHSFIFMQGDPGSGKTYACLGMCELFTRKNTSCMFRTQKQLLNEWLSSFESKTTESFTKKLSEVSVLVIDDFGTGDLSVAFLSFFMDIVNTRMQWKDRGTVVTTNLKPEELSKACGDALIDRLHTGQIMHFQIEASRRKKLIL